MAKKTVDEIVRQQLPGFHVASQASGADSHEAPSDVDATSRSLDDLKRKYLGQDSGLDEAVRQSARGASNVDDDVEIVPIEPVSSPSDADPPHRTKAAVVSKKSGKVIGEQG